MRKWLAVLLLSHIAWADPTQKALQGLTHSSLDKRLEANAVLEELDPRKLPPERVSTCIAALARAAQSEKDRFRTGDYTRCLMRYAAVSRNPEKDLVSIQPLLTHQSSEVVQYAWMGVGEWARRPLKQPVVDKLLALLDHPREQVRINALMWLCRHAQIDQALKQGKPLTPLQQKAWQRVLGASQQNQSIRLRTAGIRFLLLYSPVDEPKTLEILAAYLVQPKLDEEDFLTYDQLDGWLEQRGLEAAALAQPLEQAARLFQERKLAALNLRWRAMLGPWSAAQKNAVEQFVQEMPLTQLVPRLAEALSEHGPDGREALILLAGRLAKATDYPDDPLIYSALARVGVDSASAGDCLKRFAMKADAEHSGLLAAVGASASKDPLLHSELKAYLNHAEQPVQQAAAYSLACLGAAPEEVKKWLTRQDFQHCDGLTLGVLRRLKYPPPIPADYQVSSGETVILKRMAGQPDPAWDELIVALSEARYPFRCWRSRTLDQKEATLTCLELLRTDAPKLSREPLAIQLMMGSPDPEIARAATLCYQALWK